VGGLGRLQGRGRQHLRAFEPVRCDTFITESTFGLPIYRWRPQQEIFDEINAWWAANAAQGAPACCWATASARRSAS
jgi:putative mRNA 3-end processing factor